MLLQYSAVRIKPVDETEEKIYVRDSSGDRTQEL